MEYLIDDTLIHLMTVLHPGDLTTYFRLNKRFHSFSETRTGKDEIKKRTNHLMTIMKILNNEDSWCIERLIANPNFDIKSIEKSGYLDSRTHNGTTIRNTYYFYSNPTVDLEWINSHPPVLTDMWALAFYVAENPTIVREFIPVIFNKKIDMFVMPTSIMNNPSVDIEWVIEMIRAGRITEHAGWDWTHPGVTEELILAHEDIFLAGDARCHWRNPKVSKEFILRHTKQKRYCVGEYSDIVINPNTTIEAILENERLLQFVSYSPHLTWKYVIDHPEIKWDFKEMSSNTFGK